MPPVGAAHLTTTHSRRSELRPQKHFDPCGRANSPLDPDCAMLRWSRALGRQQRSYRLPQTTDKRSTDSTRTMRAKRRGITEGGRPTRMAAATEAAQLPKPPLPRRALRAALKTESNRQESMLFSGLCFMRQDSNGSSLIFTVDSWSTQRTPIVKTPQRGAVHSRTSGISDSFGYRATGPS
jgi:hypothetical protein